MKRLVILLCLLLAGCGGYSEINFDKELYGAYTEDDLKDAYEDGYEAGYTLAVEEAQEVIGTAYNKGVQAGSGTSQNKGTLNNEVKGYDWEVMNDDDKRSLIESIVENNRENKSLSDVESIISKIDEYFEDGGKNNTVGEVLGELQLFVEN